MFQVLPTANCSWFTAAKALHNWDEFVFLVKLLVLISLSNQFKTPPTIGSPVILIPPAIASSHSFITSLLELDLHSDETHQSSHPALAWGKTLPGLDPFPASFSQVGAGESRECSERGQEEKNWVLCLIKYLCLSMDIRPFCWAL